jgi:formamidopyrimidine-DNA glycosylase
MPELPEVQTTVNDLKNKVVGRRITDFWTDWPRGIRGLSPIMLRKKIRGSKILGVSRLGKNILIALDKNRILLIHQKMTGHLMVGRWSVKKTRTGWSTQNLIKGSFEDRVNQYIHTIFTLDGGKMLALSDMRKFARIDFGQREDVLALPALHKLGPDALDLRLSLETFKKIIKSRNKSIKQTLIDPTVIAGIGNIYADDILWSARVHPTRLSNALNDTELKNILIHTRRILSRAVKLRGTSVGDYRDASGEPGGYSSRVLVYRKTDEPCRRCGIPIKRMLLGQRSAHFCPNCQKV